MNITRICLVITILILSMAKRKRDSRNEIRKRQRQARAALLNRLHEAKVENDRLERLRGDRAKRRIQVAKKQAKKK
jgi:hypothetical protein